MSEKKKKTSKKEPVKKKKKSSAATKKTPKKTVKKTAKKEVPKKTWKEFCSSVPFLKGVFVLLLAIIVFLGVLIYQKETTKVPFDSHITIPVFQVDSNFEFGVDASLLIEEKDAEYIFKITNYRNDIIIQEDLPYSIVIENNTAAVISLTKGDDPTDLITDQEKTIISGEVLKAGVEEEVYYHLKITSHGDLKMDDFIHIEVLS